MVSNFYLFALDFNLLNEGEFGFLFFGLDYVLWSLIFDSKLGVSLSSHLFDEFFFVFLVPLLLYFIKLHLSLHGLLFCNSFGLLHLLCVSDSVLFSLFGFLLLPLLSDLSSFFSKFIKFGLCLFR
jgi:hypothetical protein